MPVGDYVNTAHGFSNLDASQEQVLIYNISKMLWRKNIYINIGKRKGEGGTE